MRRLVLPRNWPFRLCNQEERRLLFMPLIAFITCLLITIFVFFLSAMVSSSQVMREATFAASWEEAAKLTATKETFSNKTRIRIRTRTTAAKTFPFQVDSKNDRTESSPTEGVSKGNVSIKPCYESHYASGCYLSLSPMLNFALALVFPFRLFGFIIVRCVVLSSSSSSHLNLDRLAKLKRISLA